MYMSRKPGNVWEFVGSLAMLNLTKSPGSVRESCLLLTLSLGQN